MCIAKTKGSGFVVPVLLEGLAKISDKNPYHVLTETSFLNLLLCFWSVHVCVLHVWATEAIVGQCKSHDPSIFFRGIIGGF